MTLHIVCNCCEQELEEPGALVFDAPDDDFLVRKYHVCVKCFREKLFPHFSRRQVHNVYDEYNPRLYGDAALAAQNDPHKPDGACCNDEHRGSNGGCGNCGDPSF